MVQVRVVEGIGHVGTGHSRVGIRLGRRGFGRRRGGACQVVGILWRTRLVIAFGDSVRVYATNLTATAISTHVLTTSSHSFITLRIEIEFSKRAKTKSFTGCKYKQFTGFKYFTTRSLNRCYELKTRLEKNEISTRFLVRILHTFFCEPKKNCVKSSQFKQIEF